MKDYVGIVVKAQSGDLDAYSKLVDDFRDVVFACARSWLTDIDLARDASQEAFLEAYLNLSQLKDPAAFPGWLRKIVIKHCDRQTRRKMLPVVDVDPDQTRDVDTSPLATAISQQEEARIRSTVEQLPPGLRLIVALHYFAGASGPRIAEFLELPLSTVKQRLRAARKTLKEEHSMTTEQMNRVPREDFPDEVTMYIALRAGDTNQVQKLVRQTPSLLSAQQNWGRDLVYDGVLPFATQATPLITAIEVGDLKMMQLLIEEGADVNGLCGCETGEPPLWTAVLLQREQHIACLLDAGADPNVRSASGNTALHIAAMRGNTDVVKMLLGYGADKTMIDLPSEAIWPLTAGASKKPGWAPADWARHRGHDQILQLLEKDDAAVQPASTIAFCLDQDVIHTGIKAVDFFTPLKKGSLTRVPFKAGVGMLVLLGELSQGFVSHPDGEVVWTGFTQPPFDLADLEAELREFGLLDDVGLYLASYQASKEQQQITFEQGLRQLEAKCAKGRHVLAIIQSVEGFEATLEESLLRLSGMTGPGSVTSLVLTPFRDEEQSWDVLQLPYVGQIALDRLRAKRNLYPAFDPAKSLTGLSGTELGEEHVELLAKVRAVFSEDEQMDGGFLSEDKKISHPKVAALTQFFSQSFRVTETFRGTIGESVTRDDLLDGVRTILYK